MRKNLANNNKLAFEVIEEWLSELSMMGGSNNNLLPICEIQKPSIFSKDLLLKWPSYLQFKGMLEKYDVLSYAKKIYRTTKSKRFSWYAAYNRLREKLHCNVSSDLYTDDEILVFYIKEYLKNVVYERSDIIICWLKEESHGNWWDSCPIPSAVILPEDVISFDELPDNIKNKYNTAKANEKVYDLAIKPVLENIANSIGAEIKTYRSENIMGLYFDDDGFKQFVNTALKNAIESKLKETGLKFEYTDSVRKEYNTLLTIKLPDYAKGEGNAV